MYFSKYEIMYSTSMRIKGGSLGDEKKEGPMTLVRILCAFPSNTPLEITRYIASFSDAWLVQELAIVEADLLLSNVAK